MELYYFNIYLDLINHEKAKNTDIVLGTDKDKIKYWINEKLYYLNLFSGIFIWEHWIIVLFENNMKRLSDEDKKYVDNFF